MAFTCDLLKNGMKAIEILRAIWLEEDVEWGVRAPDGTRPLIATETLDDLATTAVPITDLNVVILAHVVKLQAQHDKPVGGKSESRTQVGPGQSWDPRASSVPQDRPVSEEWSLGGPLSLIP